MSKEQFYLEVMGKIIDFTKVLVPFLVGLHLPQPKWLDKKVTYKEEGQ
jgi:hypothetical protein